MSKPIRTQVFEWEFYFSHRLKEETFVLVYDYRKAFLYVGVHDTNSMWLRPVT